MKIKSSIKYILPLVLVLLFISGYLFPAKNNMPSRNVGEQFDGYWQVDKIHGCFENDTFIYITNNKIYAKIDLAIPAKKWATITKITGLGSEIVEMEFVIHKSGSLVKKIIEDRGNKLLTTSHLVKTVNSNKYKDITFRQDPIFFARCSESTWVGKLFTNLRIYSYRAPISPTLIDN